MKLIYLKIFLYLAFLGLIIFQISFLNNSLWMQSYFNLVLIILFAFLLIFSPYYLLLYVLSAGLIFDLFSQFPFGIYLIAFTLAIFLPYLLLKHILTHYSLFSFLSLVALGTILFNLFIYLSTKIIYLINLSNYFSPWSWKEFILQLIINILILALVVNRYELQKSL